MKTISFRNIVLWLCTVLFTVSSVAPADNAQERKEHLQRKLVRFPLVLVCHAERKQTRVPWFRKTPTGLYSCHVHITIMGNITEILKGSLPVALPFGFEHKLEFSDYLRNVPREGMEDIRHAEEHIIGVTAYEIKDGILYMIDYDPHFPPSSWALVREILKEQQEQKEL